MRFLDAKYAKMRLRPPPVGAPPGTPLGELTALLRPLLDLRGTSKERAREERYRKGVGEEREDRAEEGRGEGREKGEDKGKWGTGEGNGHTGTSFSPLRALVRV